MDVIDQPAQEVQLAYCLYLQDQVMKSCQAIENTIVTPEYIQISTNGITQEIHLCYYEPVIFNTGR